MDWKKIWENKGNSKSSSLKELDGFEHTSINEIEVAKTISSLLNIKIKDRVLEIGCGAGMIAQYLECDYVGVDYSRSLISKHIKILNNSVLFCEANNLIFKDKTFDKVFAYSIFQYFPTKEYSINVIEEMKRVSREIIFIGDLPLKSHDSGHQLFNYDEFPTWKLSTGFYNTDRFNALLIL